MLAQANQTLGSQEPNAVKLTVLDLAEFESLILQPSDEPEVLRSWLRQIVRGRDQEFSELLTAAEPRRLVG